MQQLSAGSFPLPDKEEMGRALTACAGTGWKACAGV